MFDFVCDLAGRPAYTDHFMDDYRLARVKPVGVGAAARFRLNAPMSNEYAELTITEATARGGSSRRSAWAAAAAAAPWRSTTSRASRRASHAWS